MPSMNKYEPSVATPAATLRDAIAMTRGALEIVRRRVSECVETTQFLAIGNDAQPEPNAEEHPVPLVQDVFQLIREVHMTETLVDTLQQRLSRL